jgi:hypothetical protein
VDAGAANSQRLLVQLAGDGLGKSFVFCQEEPRQRVQRALSKLQIILRAEIRRKSGIFRHADQRRNKTRGVYGSCTSSISPMPPSTSTVILCSVFP